MSLSFAKKKTTTQQQSQTDPWDVAIPSITDFLKNVPTGATAGPTAAQTAAYDDLKQQAAAGNPNTGDIFTLANDQFGFQSEAPTARQGYEDFQRRLTPVADGTNLDIGNNDYIQRLVTQVGDNAAKRVNAQFAAAGRDSSGANLQSVGRGVTEATLPILVDQYNREASRTDAAARDLYAGANTTAQTVQGLNTNELAARQGGIDTVKSALEAQGYGPTQIINLEEQLKQMPLDDLERIANILYPAGKLGEQSSGTGTSKSKSSGFGISLSDIGKIASGLGSLG